jgi:hypothetical protein
MRLNNRQQAAQILRFEQPSKQGIMTSRADVVAAISIGEVCPIGVSGHYFCDLIANSCIQDLATHRPLEEACMAETVIKLRLNQQQLELLDRTIAQGVAADRVSLVRLALREYAAARGAEASR